jgi:hypothetical protein
VALHGVKVRVKVLYFSNIVYYLNFSLKWLWKYFLVADSS